MDHYWKTAGDVINCFNSSIQQQRPIWNPSVYHMMREIYVDTVTVDAASFEVNNNASEAARAMHIPYSVDYIPKKGRGIISTEFIPKYTTVWSASDHAVFESQPHFKRFLERIGYDLACDVLMWAYVEPCEIVDYDKLFNTTTGKLLNTTISADDDVCFQVGVELGDASLINGVNVAQIENVAWCTDFNVDGKTAIDCKGDTMGMIATRDIQPGEEILIDYDEFSFDNQLLWFDRLYDKAWDDPNEKNNTALANNDTTTTTTATTNTKQETEEL